VDVIDICRWHYRDDGSLYAPNGGQNLAPRQHARLVPPGRTSFEQVYRAVREYRQRYPDKAILYSADSGGDFAWAAFLAGGSLAGIPRVSEAGLLERPVSMRPVDGPDRPAGQWRLGNARGESIVYCRSADSLRLNLNAEAGALTVYWIDPGDGSLLRRQRLDRDAGSMELKSPTSGPVVVWVTRSHDGG